MIGAGVFFGYMGMRTYRTSERRHAYQPVEATILNSRLIESSSRRGSISYKPDIQYEYTVGGETYKGTRGDLFPGSFAPSGKEQEKQQRMVDKYPEGAVVEAYYDPNDPSTSFLEKKSMKRSAIKTMVASGLVVVVGFVILTL